MNVEGEPICRRKVLYTYDAAIEALRWRRLRKGGEGLKVYHCPEHGAYHLGHDRLKETA